LCTCPFQSASDIDRLIKKILHEKYNSAAIISKAKQHPEKAIKILGYKKNKIVSYISAKGTDVGSNNNRQAYKPAFFRGNVLACKTKVIEKFNSLTDNNVGYIIIPHKRAIDIDDELDFILAKYLSKVLKT
jgi:N-acylneuraminate cytidylyltransferase